MEIIAIILLLSFALLSFACIVIAFVYSLFFSIIPILFLGAFFAPTGKDIAEKMAVVAGIRPGDKAVDLGSGDGRLVIALANAGAEAHGYEINSILVWLSRYKIKKAGLSGRAFVHHKSFWGVDFSQFDIVTVFGINYMMKRLEAKLKKELKPGSRVVSYFFTFPTWQYSKKEDNIYLYKV